MGAMSLVLRIFELTEQFPGRERYVLTDQIRRSSRSVCANLAEAWRKRRYEGAFVSKLSDAEAGAAETQVHIEIAFRHGYLNQEVFDELDNACDKILGQIVKMIDHADRWLVKRPGNASRE
jgi:four helix bundle protein